jgi:peptidoglycan hydrolase-like protein with peptidoglycan-binding domain
MLRPFVPAARRGIVLALAPVIALLGLLAAPAVPVEAAFTCNYSFDESATAIVTWSGGSLGLAGMEFAGHYSGSTVVPATTSVSAAGVEAQCLLKRAGFNPGTIDGIFGPNSQAAARSFQSRVDSDWPGALVVDGLPGPHTWPWLRHYAA